MQLGPFSPSQSRNSEADAKLADQHVALKEPGIEEFLNLLDKKDDRHEELVATSQPQQLNKGISMGSDVLEASSASISASLSRICSLTELLTTNLPPASDKDSPSRQMLSIVDQRVRSVLSNIRISHRTQCLPTSSATGAKSALLLDRCSPLDRCSSVKDCTDQRLRKRLGSFAFCSEPARSPPPEVCLPYATWPVACMAIATR